MQDWAEFLDVRRKILDEVIAALREKDDARLIRALEWLRDEMAKSALESQE